MVPTRRRPILRFASTLCFALLILSVSPLPTTARPTQTPKASAERTQGGHSSIGPAIVVRSPIEGVTYGAEVPIEVEFAAGPRGVPVDMGSLRVTYQSWLPIDITDRVRDHMTQNAILVPDAQLPAGEHEVEIYVEDQGHNATRRRLRISIVD